jgi:hypothetical protein
MGGEAVPSTVTPHLFGARASAQFPRRSPRRGIAGAVRRMDRLLPKRRECWWLVCLFRRDEPVS